MSGLLAKTVHQSPVVPSHLPGSATGSRPSKSHSYMVVTIGAVASSLGTWRSLGMEGLCARRLVVGAGGAWRDEAQTGVGWAGCPDSVATLVSTARSGACEMSDG